MLPISVFNPAVMSIKVSNSGSVDKHVEQQVTHDESDDYQHIGSKEPSS